nr:hypothetical protein [uncultured Porphyromonas sp.]
MDNRASSRAGSCAGNRAGDRVAFTAIASYYHTSPTPLLHLSYTSPRAGCHRVFLVWEAYHAIVSPDSH